jgi:type IV pilus assembly protein PilA
MNIKDLFADCSRRLAYKAQRGFTLIELMIVIAIIGILAAIAIPAYQNYLIRSQVTEGLSLADGYKTAVSEFYAQYGAFPSGISAGGLAPTAGTTTCGGSIAAPATSSAGKYSTVTVGACGQIQITYGLASNAKLIANPKLDITPGGDINGDIIWVCGKSAVPASATNPAPAADTSSVLAQYLPSACHA